MKKDEFIKNACMLGYCNKDIATEYCKDKETFTDDDYIEVYRKAEGQKHKPHGHGLGNGSYTTRKYYRDGGLESDR